MLIIRKSTFAKALTANLSDRHDEVHIEDLTGSDDVHILMGAGDDFLEYCNTTFPQTATHELNGGADNDIIKIDTAKAFLPVNFEHTLPC